MKNCLNNRGTFITFITLLVINGCNLITGIFTARILGPVGRGELATILLWPTILSNLGLLGINWALARNVAAHPYHESNWIFVSAILGLATSIVYLIIGFFLIPYLLPLDKQHLIYIINICLWFIPLDIFSQTLLAVDHGSMRWGRYNLLRLSFFVVYLILILLIWAAKEDQLYWFIWAFLLSHFLTVCLRLGLQWKAMIYVKIQMEDGLQLIRKDSHFFWPRLAIYFLSR